MRAKRKPSLVHHKPTGQARVRINGKDHYLGKWGSPESLARYEVLIGEWVARNGDVAGATLRLDDLAIAYLAHAGRYYVKNGEPTSEVLAIKAALRFVVASCGTLRAREFSPRKLREVRDAMIAAGLARTTINQNASRIRRMFRWATAEGLVPGSVWHDLQSLQGLRAGRTEAKEPERVQPVEWDRVEATMPHLPPVLQAMVRLQWLTGMRPGEVCSMRPADVTVTTAGAWVYRPREHKTEHRGRDRRIFIGPEGQAVLRPYLARDPEAFCFSPAEAMRQRRGLADVLPLKSRKYGRSAYGRAIARACELAFGMPADLQTVPGKLPAAERRRLKGDPAALREAARRWPEVRDQRRAAAREWRELHCWHPNQLRHAAATRLREQYGIEAARLALGHADAGMTEVYAEKDFATAARIAAEVG